MWYLTSDNDKRIIYLIPGKEVIIGRSLDAQSCNFAVPEDPSISRKHATIFVSENDLCLKDLGSKYGTYVNNSEKVEHNLIIKLNFNDNVKFGKMSCTWKVEQINFITCTSTLKGENLQNLKHLLIKLGGTFMTEWDDTCQYLTMPAITLTIKVVLALVQNSNIVTMNYWSKCVEAITNNTPLPNAGDFIPQILESTLNKENVSFLPLKERCSIFAGKRIIFFSRRQLELYKVVLEKSSGTALLLSDSKLTKSALCEDNVIVIQYSLSSSSQETQTQKDQIMDIINYLKSKGRRIVADAEIGLAVLYCSTEKYCNPNFNFTSEVIKQELNQIIPNNVLVQESEEITEIRSKKDNVLIDESLSPRHNSSNLNNDVNSVASKRKLSDDNNSKICSLNKKLAIDTVNMNNKSTKRPSENLHNSEANPSKKMALDNNDGDEIFNFLEPSVANNMNDSSQNKKLNLSKPLKRKHSTDMDEDDLFNFVDKKLAIDKDHITNNLQSFNEGDNSIAMKKTTKIVIEDTADIISALRGSKLDELMKINCKIPCHRNIKKEDISELDNKFNGMDLGSTIVVVKTLIVKREPLQINCPQSELKNFKKFKKVWPIKMQVTMISNSHTN